MAIVDASTFARDALSRVSVESRTAYRWSRTRPWQEPLDSIATPQLAIDWKRMCDRRKRACSARRRPAARARQATPLACPSTKPGWSRPHSGRQKWDLIGKGVVDCG